MHRDLRIAVVVCALGAMFGSVGVSAKAQQSKKLVAEGCLVSLVDDRSVPAKEAGTLAKVNVREGDEVRAHRPKRGDRAGDETREVVSAKPTPLPLAIVEQEMALYQREAAAAVRDQAVADARNRAGIEFAESQQAYAELQLKQYVEANQKRNDVITKLEMAKAEQEVQTAKLRVKQTEHEFAQSALAAVEKEADLKAAEESLGRREIYSPIDGLVAEVFAEKGEWVKPGDPVFRVVNLGRLRVQASFNVADCHPSALHDREVTIVAEPANGIAQSFPGHVTFVQPEIKAGGRFTVWAEVENRKNARGHYQLLPGMKVTLTVEPAN